jgi:hypothetical protein
MSSYSIDHLEIVQFETIVYPKGQQFERRAIEIVETRNQFAPRTSVTIRDRAPSL